MPLISIARLRFLKAAKIQKFMLILGSCIGRSFIAFFHFIPYCFKSEIQLGWIHFTFCVVAPWEDSIWSPLCPTNPFSVASWHTFLLIFFPPWFHCIAAQCIPSPPASPTSLVPPPSADYSHIMSVWRWVPPTAQQTPPLPFTSSSLHKLSSWVITVFALFYFQ